MNWKPPIKVYIDPMNESFTSFTIKEAYYWIETYSKNKMRNYNYLVRNAQRQSFLQDSRIIEVRDGIAKWKD